MILLLDTSTPTCKLSLVDGAWRYDAEWQADRTLALGLLRYIEDRLTSQRKTWRDISAIAAYKGPGSFTGLRIGLTVLNTLADANALPIVGTTGDSWQIEALQRLERGETDGLVMPLYGSEAHITKSRK